QKNKEEVEDDEEEKEDEYVRTPSYYSPTDDEDKTNFDDNDEGDKDEEMGYTNSQLYDDVDIRQNEPVNTDEGLVQKEGADVFTKKNTRKQSIGVVLRDTLMETSSRRKEKMDVTRGKGINLVSEVSVAKDAQYEKVRKKSLRDFHKTHPSGYARGVVIRETVEMPLSKWKQKVDVTRDHKDEEEEVKDKFVKTSSNNFDDEDETKITDKAKGDEDVEMDYTTSQLYDDTDIRLNELLDIDKGFVQEEGTNAAMTNIQHGNGNSDILQVIEDAHEDDAKLTEFVGIKGLHGVTTAQVNTVFNKVNVASSRVTTADIVTTTGWIKTEMT
nr:hypothetical protein [Tanacetum cinerariifolium]